MQPSSAQIVERAYELLRLQRYDLALAEVQRALAADPDAAAPHVCGAWVLRAQKRYAEAEQSARAALHADPNSTDALHVLAVALWCQNRLREAEAAFKDTLRQPGGDWTPYVMNYARLLLAQGRNQEALALAEQALTRTPNAASAHELRGRALHALGDFRAAAAAYRAALRCDPRNAIALNNLGVLDLAGGRVETAIESFQTLLRQSPGEADAQANLIRALKARNWLYGWVTRARIWARSPLRRWLNIALGVIIALLALLVLLAPVLGEAVRIAALGLFSVAVLGVLVALFLAVCWNALAEPVFNTLLLRDPANRFVLETYDSADAAVTGALLAALLTALLYGGAALALGAAHPLADLAGGLCIMSLVAMLLTQMIRGTSAGWRKVVWVCYGIMLFGMYVLPFGIVLQIEWFSAIGTLCLSNAFLVYLLGWMIVRVRQRMKPKKE